MDQKPSLGRIVTYRNQADIDTAALVTGVAEADPDGTSVHLFQFPPPGHGADHVDRQWGAPYSDQPTPGTWRWPERA